MCADSAAIRTHAFSPHSPDDGLETEVGTDASVADRLRARCLTPSVKDVALRGADLAAEGDERLDRVGHEAGRLDRARKGVRARVNRVRR